MRNHLILAAAIGTLALGGCANMTDTQKNTAKGAGVGAATGAAVGALAGGGEGAAIGAGVGAALGAGGGYLWDQHMEDQKQAMETATEGTGVEVTQTENNELKLEIPSDLSFDTGEAEVKAELRPVLDEFAATLKANPMTTLRIVGHTDSTGSAAVNEPLSLERAESVRDYLVTQGIESSRISIDGAGSAMPVADNSTAEGRAQNRRVEIFVAQPPATAQQ